MDQMNSAAPSNQAFLWYPFRSQIVHLVPLSPTVCFSWTWFSDGVFYMKNLCYQVCIRVRVVSGSCFDSIYPLMCNMWFSCTIKMVYFILCLLLGGIKWYSWGTDLCLVAMLPRWKSAGKGRANCFDLILKCQWLSDGSFMEVICSR